MSAKKFAGPCSLCGRTEPSGRYKKKMCWRCYGKLQRRAQGITGERPKLWEGPCIACGRKSSRYKKKMCDTCYKRIIVHKGSPKRRAKYNGPCAFCGIEDGTLKYSRKLCPTCYARVRQGSQPRRPKYTGPCVVCGSATSTSGRFYSKMCRRCYGVVDDRARIDDARRKARIAQVEDTLTVEQWQKVLRHFEYRCAYCDKDIRDSYTIDHVIPISAGGGNVISNVVCACLSCNSSKRERPAPKRVITLKE